MSEHNEQVALFSWANLSKNKYPGISFLMLDEKNCTDAIWKLLKPKATKPFKEEI